MSYPFRRRISLAPGVTLKLPKSGGPLSFGPRGAKYTIGPRGSRSTVGLPGTGLSDRVHGPNRGNSRPASVPAQDRLRLGFLQRLVTSADECGPVEGRWGGGAVERRKRNAEAIADRAGRLHDSFLGFLENMETVGRPFDQAQAACGDALGQLPRGRGNLLSQVKALKALGARAIKSICVAVEYAGDAPARSSPAHAAQHVAPPH